MVDLFFFILSTVAALYAAYLLTFRLYKVDYNMEMDERRVIFPRIVYILAFCISFIPFINFVGIAAFISFLAFFSEDYHVKSWLFEKPKLHQKK